MSEGRQLVHPGPVAARRITALPCLATKRRVTLQAGSTLLQAMIDATGGQGAWFDLRDVRVKMLTFVRPAPSPDDSHVAWYGAQTVLIDATITVAGAHLGWRDGAGFAHVHGLWSDRNGTHHAGHLLAEASILAADHVVDAWLMDGARMQSAPDPETGFTLFHPTRTGPVDAPNAVLATIRPNVIIDDALARIAATAGSPVTRIKGLGSLVGTRLAGQAGLDDHATEVLLTGDAGQGVIAVGFDGPAVAGDLAAGVNRVCVTFEVLLLTETS